MTTIPIALDEDRIAELCHLQNFERLTLFGSVLRDDFISAPYVDGLDEFEPPNSGVRFLRRARPAKREHLRLVDLDTRHLLSRYSRGPVWPRLLSFKSLD